MKYRVTKTYGHDRGLSCAFRQYKATSHCQWLHGYALAFAVTFEADELDHRGWVVDFGSMDDIKDWLVAMFDHTTLIARDDPQIMAFGTLKNLGIINLVVVNDTGCEAFAKALFFRVNQWLHAMDLNGRVRIHSIDVMEHGANKASVVPEHHEAH